MMNVVKVIIGDLTANYTSKTIDIFAPNADILRTYMLMVDGGGVPGKDGIQGEPGEGVETSWLGLATGFESLPIIVSTISSGVIYAYRYFGNITFYRYIANNGTLDAFYRSFTDGVLSDIIASKKLDVSGV